MREAIEGAQVGIFHWDLENNAFIWSSTFRDILQLSAEIEPSLDNWLARVYSEDRDRIRHLLDGSLQSLEDLNVEYRIIWPTGEQRWNQLKARIEGGTDGQSALTIKGGVIDVTKRRNAEEARKVSEERFRTMVEASSDILFRASPDWQKVYSLSGGHWPEKNCEERKCWLDRHIPPDDQAMVLRVIDRAVRNKTAFEMDHQLIRLDGSTGWAYSKGIPRLGPEGELIEWLGMVTDVTERHELESEILQLNMNLAKKVDELGTATKTKSLFLANVSHEIRSPLNTINILTHLLENHELATEKRDSLTRRLSASARALISIVDDILDFSRIEAGQVELDRQPFRLQELAENVDAVVHDKAQAKGIELIIESDPRPLTVKGDIHRIQEIMVNLIDNAIKFTSEGKVRFGSRILSNTDSVATIQLMVTDSGIGISAEKLPQLFRPFSQVDGSINREYGGSGLGLSICKGLIDLMGGEVAVTSTPGIGSTFEIILKLPVVPLVKTPLNGCQQFNSDHALQGLKILLVDDDAATLETMRDMVEAQGGHPDCVSDGQQACDRLKARPHDYDAILMDIQMPVLDGIHAARVIRNELAIHELPIIAITAGLQTDQLEEAIASGITELMRKPVHPAALVELVNRHCRAEPPILNMTDRVQ